MHFFVARLIAKVNYIAYGEMTRDSTGDESSPFDSFEDSAADAGDLPTGIQEWRCLEPLAVFAGLHIHPASHV